MTSTPRAVIASEAKRSRTTTKTLDRFVAALLAMTAPACAPATADETRLPAPAVTLYPGDVVGDSSLVDIVVPYALPAGAALTDRARIVGRVARRTLLPGKPIPAGALDDARLVANGAQVRLVFNESGLLITTFGQAMGAGGRGDIVRVRNAESGVIVSGAVQADGSVKVGE